MLKIQYLGQNGFIVDYGTIKVCFDLYLSNCVYELTGSGVRNYPVPVAAEELTDIDYYFISHDHLDHLDPYTIKEVAKASPKTTFICPYPHTYMLEKLGILEERIIKARAYEKVELNEIGFTAIPEKHEKYSVINGEHGNLGYIVSFNEFKIYHGGDVIADKKLADDLKECGPFDIMFVPINGHDWKRYSEDTMGNMNYREALDLCNYVGTELVIPMHYDLFACNTENPAYFVDYLYKNYPTQKFKMFMPGEEIFIDN